jgi:hypothetical protein
LVLGARWDIDGSSLNATRTAGRRAVLAPAARRCYVWPKETRMSDLARIEIERDVADAAARRAAEEGLTVTAFISMLLRRNFERLPGEESVLVYDHVDGGGELCVDREVGEDDEAYKRRSDLYDSLFGRCS